MKNIIASISLGFIITQSILDYLDHHGLWIMLVPIVSVPQIISHISPSCYKSWYPPMPSLPIQWDIRIGYSLLHWKFIWGFPQNGGTPKSSIYKWMFMDFPWNKPSSYRGHDYGNPHVSLFNHHWIPIRFLNHHEIITVNPFVAGIPMTMETLIHIWQCVKTLVPL